MLRELIQTLPACARTALLTLGLSGLAFAGSSAVGKPLPTFDLPSLAGSGFSSRELAGKVAVVDLWSTWCGPCIKEIPHLNELAERYGGRGLTVVGITLQSGWAQDIRNDIESRKLNFVYPVLVGDDDVEEAFGNVLAFPTTLLVDRSGKIRKKYVGVSEDKAADMERAIRALLAESFESE